MKESREKVMKILQEKAEDLVQYQNENKKLMLQIELLEEEKNLKLSEEKLLNDEMSAELNLYRLKCNCYEQKIAELEIKMKKEAEISENRVKKWKQKFKDCEMTRKNQSLSNDPNEEYRNILRNETMKQNLELNTQIKTLEKKIVQKDDEIEQVKVLYDQKIKALRYALKKKDVVNQDKQKMDEVCQQIMESSKKREIELRDDINRLTSLLDSETIKRKAFEKQNKRIKKSIQSLECKYRSDIRSLTEKNDCLYNSIQDFNVSESSISSENLFLRSHVSRLEKKLSKFDQIKNRLSEMETIIQDQRVIIEDLKNELLLIKQEKGKESNELSVILSPFDQNENGQWNQQLNIIRGIILRIRENEERVKQMEILIEEKDHIIQTHEDTIISTKSSLDEMTTKKKELHDQLYQILSAFGPFNESNVSSTIQKIISLQKYSKEYHSFVSMISKRIEKVNFESQNEIHKMNCLFDDSFPLLVSLRTIILTSVFLNRFKFFSRNQQYDPTTIMQFVTPNDRNSQSSVIRLSTSVSSLFAENRELSNQLSQRISENSSLNDRILSLEHQIIELQKSKEQIKEPVIIEEPPVDTINMVEFESLQSELEKAQKEKAILDEQNQNLREELRKHLEISESFIEQNSNSNNSELIQENNQLKQQITQLSFDLENSMIALKAKNKEILSLERSKKKTHKIQTEESRFEFDEDIKKRLSDIQHQLLC